MHRLKSNKIGKDTLEAIYLEISNDDSELAVKRIQTIL